jgi:hypothetical protein
VTRSSEARRRPARRTRRPTSPWRWIRKAPGWIQGAAALVAPLLALLAFFGIRGLSADEPVPDARVEIGEARVDADTLAVDGAYAGLLPDSETIVVLVRLSDADDPVWTAVEADRAPARETGDREEGVWEAADIPVVDAGVYEVSAAIIPARRGGGFDSSTTEELREAGPDASIVRSRAETVSVGD